MQNPIPRTVRVELPDGRWLRFQIASVNDQLAVIDLPESKTEETAIANTRFARDLLTERHVENSWGGEPMAGVALDELMWLLNRWLEATEEEAVPKATGSDSETQPAQQRSANRRQRRSRSSS